MKTLIEEIVDIAPELLEQINTQEEKQVIVHATVTGIPNLDTIRVWPTIYLIPKGTSHKCKLLHYFNIVIYPKWQTIGPSGKHNFTLLFEGLPADCVTFDIVEIIDESGAFESRNIPRNEEDVYNVTF
jgi:hypothetical protein